MRHGSYVSYKDTDIKCRCKACTEGARRQHIGYRLRRNANGGRPLLVPADVAMRQIRHLRLIGYNSLMLAAHSGLNNGHIAQIAYGRWKTITPATAQKIGRMFVELKDFPGTSKITATFARKAGWTLFEDDALLDETIDAVAIDRALKGEHVRLTPEERAAAVRIGSQRGLLPYQIAVLLHMNGEMVNRYLAGGGPKKRGPKKKQAA